MDPVTGLPIDFGVNVWNDWGPARAFFDRMNVSVSDPVRAALTSRYIDFKTGLPVNYTPASFPFGIIPALQRFYDAVLPYEQYLLPGYFNFPAPNAIPEDLLLPFHKFVQKYNLEDCMNIVFETTGLGTGDMMNSLTIWVLATFNTPMLESFLGLAGTFTPTSRRNIEIYEAVATRLSTDVLYKSTVIQTIRTATGVSLWVKNSLTNQITLVHARKLLISIEPTVDSNLAPFALDHAERSVFSKFDYSVVQAGLVSHPALPVQYSLVNIPGSAVRPNGTTDYTVLPKPTFNIRFDSYGGDSQLFRVMLVGKKTETTAGAQKRVKDNFNAMVAQGTLPTIPGSGPLVIHDWSNHGPMHARVSAKELKKGFLQKLYALQGRRSTWWTGGAFSANFQAVVWAFDDVLLPQLVAA